MPRTAHGPAPVTTDLPASRSALRQHYRRARRGLSVTEQRTHSLSVARHLKTSTLLLSGGIVAAYLPNQADGELDAVPAVQQLWAMGRSVCVPVIGSERGFMDLYRLTPSTRLIENRLGIAEPEPGSPHVNVRAVALMLVPLVAFDPGGARLGMGGGFYDRFLGAVPRGLRPRLVGLAHETQRSNAALPCESWDIRLDAVVTEAGVQLFR